MDSSAAVAEFVAGPRSTSVRRPAQGVNAFPAPSRAANYREGAVPRGSVMRHSSVATRAGVPASKRVAKARRRRAVPKGLANAPRGISPVVAGASPRNAVTRTPAGARTWGSIRSVFSAWTGSASTRVSISTNAITSQAGASTAFAIPVLHSGRSARWMCNAAATSAIRTPIPASRADRGTLSAPDTWRTGTGLAVASPVCVS